MVTLLTMVNASRSCRKTRQRTTRTWDLAFLRVRREAIVKAKIGATLEGRSVKAYIIKLVDAHWLEMEKKGLLPKGK